MEQGNGELQQAGGDRIQVLLTTTSCAQVRYIRQRDFLLDQHHVIRVKATGISLYDVTSGGDSREPSRGLLCHFELPSVVDDSSDDIPRDRYPRSYMQRPASAYVECVPHYECDPERTVLTLLVESTLAESEPRRSLIFIPTSTILGYARSLHKSSLPLSSTRVPWDAWGAHGARVVLLADNCDFLRCTSLGSRIVVCLCDGRESSYHYGEEILFVFDVRAAIGKPFSQFSEGTASILEISDCLNAPDMFNGSVVSTLPYRVVGKWYCEWTAGNPWWDIIQNIIYPLCDGLLHVVANY